MKAVIVEIDSKYAAALTDNGQFIKIKNDNYSIGMTVDLENGKNGKKKTIRICTAAIAAAAAIFFCVIGLKDFNTPYGLVSIDVNPSVEININRYDRVLDIEAVNDDAKEIVEQLENENIKYKKIDVVTDIFFNQFDKGDYETEDGTTFVVLSANTKDADFSEELVSRLESVSSEYENINAQFVVADDELVERAKEAGTTAGKMYLVDQLRKSYGEKEINEEEWIKKPVKEIVGEINELNNEHGNNIPPEGEQNAQMPQPNDQEIPQPLNNGQKEEINSNAQDNKIPFTETTEHEDRHDVKEENSNPGGQNNHENTYHAGNPPSNGRN